MNTVTKRGLKGREISRNGHQRVDKLPRLPECGVSYWLDSPNGRHEFTHQLFRFPAKFHPPVVRWALGNYGRKESVVLDPFTGSGTVQVEALARGISSVGVDIDPLACMITRAKTTPLNPKSLERAFEKIQEMLIPFVEIHSDREVRPGSDISETRFDRESAEVTFPPIPNITHWFRRYVIIDIARIFGAIESADLSGREKLFFRACMAAVIRRVSNADPDPVSGLEVTSIQAERNTQRKIKVFDEFFVKAHQAIAGMGKLWNVYRASEIKAVARVLNGNASQIANLLEEEPLAQDRFPLVITSPPYCRAVEYSRRHQLELYWLGLVDDPTDHIALTHRYIGRKLVRAADWDETVDFGIRRLDQTLQRIAERDYGKSRSVRHYFHSVKQVMQELSQVVKRTGTVICVIGNSECCKVPIATADFIAELASERFALENRFSYALRNHYMQYGLWNGDGIKQEHVLVMKPR